MSIKIIDIRSKVALKKFGNLKKNTAFIDSLGAVQIVVIPSYNLEGKIKDEYVLTYNPRNGVVTRFAKSNESFDYDIVNLEINVK